MNPMTPDTTMDNEPSSDRRQPPGNETGPFTHTMALAICADIVHYFIHFHSGGECSKVDNAAHRRFPSINSRYYFLLIIGIAHRAWRSPAATKATFVI